jgi:hypothetical protein
VIKRQTKIIYGIAALGEMKRPRKAARIARLFATVIIKPDKFS